MLSHLWNMFGPMGMLMRIRSSIGARLPAVLLPVAVCTVGIVCVSHARAETQQNSDAIDSFLHAPSSTIADAHAKAILVQTGKRGFARLANSPHTSLALLSA